MQPALSLGRQFKGIPGVFWLQRSCPAGRGKHPGRVLLELAEATTHVHTCPKMRLNISCPLKHYIGMQVESTSKGGIVVRTGLLGHLTLCLSQLQALQAL